MDPNAPQASLNPPSLGQYGEWTTGQVYYPEIFIPGTRFAGVQARDYVLNLNNANANVETLRRIQIDIPGTVYAMTASARDTTAAITAQPAQPLDTFKARIQHNSGDRFTTESTYGSCIFGRVGFPRLVGARGWMWDRGGTILVGITPLYSNLDIDVTLWVIEFRGLQNYTQK